VAKDKCISVPSEGVFRSTVLYSKSNSSNTPRPTSSANPDQPTPPYKSGNPAIDNAINSYSNKQPSPYFDQNSVNKLGFPAGTSLGIGNG
jgi:hypothetical protein